MEFQEFLDRLSKPAGRALLHEGIDRFEKLARLTEKEFLALHGIGPKSLPVAHECLHAVGLAFKTD